MSTILKALRRVEQERPATPAPPRRAMRGDIVADSDGRPPPRRKRSGPNLALWGSLGAVALLAALVWWRLPQPESAEIAEAQPPERVERARPAAEERARPTAEQPAAADSAPALPQESAPPMRSPAERLAARTQSAALAPDPAAPPAAAEPEVPVELAERLPPLGTPLAVPALAAPSPSVAAVPTPEPVQAAAPPAPAPAVAQPVPEAKPSSPPRPAAKPAPVVSRPRAPAIAAPGVRVERTSWHPKPERRVAWVKLADQAETRVLHEGELAGELVVKEIRPSAVVFQLGADTLERRVGEH